MRGLRSFEFAITFSDSPVAIAGTFHSARFYSYTRAMVTITAAGGTESRHIGVAGKSWTYDATNGQWDEDKRQPDFLAIPAYFLTGAPSALIDPALEGSQSIGGEIAYVISAHLPDNALPMVHGPSQITYWIAAVDRRLLQVDIKGALRLAGLEGVETVYSAQRLTAKLSDHGRAVNIAIPGLVTPIFDHQAILLDDGRVLTSGGFTGVANNDFIVPAPQFYIYIHDFRSNSWLLAEPPEPLGLFYSMLKLADGGILAVGPSNEEGQTSNVAARFDPVTNQWTRLLISLAERAEPNLALLDDGRVLLAGGWNFNEDSFSPVSSNLVEIYDPDTGEVQEAAEMNNATVGQAAERLHDGRILVVSASGRSDLPATAEIYDPVADTWTFTNPMQTERDYPKAVTLRDGRVLVDGGTSPSEIFDPLTGVWTQAGDPAQYRTHHSLTLLPDGRVLAAGGDDPWSFDYNLYVDTALFDPDTGTWRPGPALAEPRSDHSATLLPDGRVLLIGGISQETERYLLSSVEFVRP